jgi:type II secretory pathway pseudopilin PulG
MRKSRNYNDGFSLTECLLAIGTIAVGMLFIAGVFPVGIHFNTIASERTIAAVVADEAFAKIRLYAAGNPIDANDDIALGLLVTGQLTNYGPPIVGINPIEYAYPSDPNIDIYRKQFYWSALCRLTEPYIDPNDPRRLVQVTVFVSRKTGSSLKYPGPPDGSGLPVDWPMPVRVEVTGILGSETLVMNNPLQKVFINDGYTIVDDENGQIYRVLERDTPPNDTMLRLDRPWNPGNILPDAVWVVPPPITGGRGPCIAIYQRVIRF